MPNAHIFLNHYAPEHDDDVLVVLAASPNQWVGVVIATYSAAASAGDARHRLLFHWLCDEDEDECDALRALYEQCAAKLFDGSLRVRIVRFSGVAVRARVAVTHINAELNWPHNFARFYLDELFVSDSVSQVLYLDADMLVLQSLVALADELASVAAASSGSACAAPPSFARSDAQRTNGTASSSGGDKCVLVAAAARLKPLALHASVWGDSKSLRARVRQALALGTQRNASDVRDDELAAFFAAPSFNAGFMIYFMRAWRAARADAQLDAWMRFHAQAPDAWALGTQPPLLLVTFGRVHWLEQRWNMMGEHVNWNVLRKESYGPHKAVVDAHRGLPAIVHWHGTFKPWSLPHDKHEWQINSHAFWRQYTANVESGTCPVRIAIGSEPPRLGVSQRALTLSGVSATILAFEHAEFAFLFALIVFVLICICLFRRSKRR